MTKRSDGLYLRKGKTKDTWYLRFMFQGNRYQPRIGSGISRSVAREIATVKRTAILKGEAGIGGKKRKDIPFQNAAEEFIKWAKANRREGTACQYEGCLRRLSREFGGTMLSQVSPFAFEKFKQKRIAEGSHVTVNREIGTLSTLFNRMTEWNLYEGPNPAKGVRRLKEEQRKLRWLTEDEESRLLAASPEPFKTIFLVGIYSGLRVRAEALTLQWGNIDFGHRQVTVLSCYSKNGKTEVVPLHSKLVQPLLTLREGRQNEWVFTDTDGQPLRSVHRQFAAACRKADIQGVSPHVLRHTFASRLAMAGVNDRTLQKLGRWRQPKMIMRYAHLSDEHLTEAIERIGKGDLQRGLLREEAVPANLLARKTF